MRQNAIVILVDRLGTGLLGPYGNTWIETPALNRLATESLLWEQMLATGPTLADTYRTLGSGAHPLAVDNPTRLWALLRQAGVRTSLVSDEDELSQPGVATEFVDFVNCRERSEKTADVPEDTDMARVFMAAMEWLESAREPFCLVLHSRGMSGPWDAPYEFRERFADEEDPAPPDFLAPPDRLLGGDPDPDELLGFSQAYAGQVVLMDMCLEMLVDHLTESSLIERTLLIFTSPRGFPLGEHGGVGPSGDALHEELIHVPLVIRHPDRRYALVRNQSLAQTPDLHVALAKWFDLGLPEPPLAAVDVLTPSDWQLREYVVAALGKSRAIRTPAWFLKLTEDAPPALFAKPDDRWEVNEVAARAGDVVENLTEAITTFEQLAQADRLAELPQLAEPLLRRLD